MVLRHQCSYYQHNLLMWYYVARVNHTVAATLLTYK